MDIKFRTLTPVFTGDKKQQGDRLHETGLLGSLRFWAAAAARGLGYDIVTDSGNLPQNRDKKLDIIKLDPVTRLFGCTGWRRTFNLKVHVSPVTSLPQSRPKLNVMVRNHGWYLTPGCLFPWNELVTVCHTFRKPLDDKWKTEGQQWLALVWDLIDRLASIGAHQAWGYGQIRLENLKLTQFSLDDVHSTHNTGWPDLADFVFAEYEFDHPVTLSPLSGRKFFKERPLWDTKNKTPALMTPVGLSLRYLLHYPENCIRCPTTIKSWDTLFFGDKGKEDPAGRFNGSLLYRVDSKGNPDTHGEKYRFRVWAWLPKNIFNGETDGLPAWCDAAKMLRDVLQNDDLWNAVAGCKPPDECYFWPLKNAKLIPALRRIAPLLGVIEDRARSSLKRTCI